MTQAFLELSFITKTFATTRGSFVALKDVALKVREGEFVAILGHSGCGKSTLLNIVAGLSDATEGGVILEGKHVDEPGPDRMMVFQNYALLPWLTAFENVYLGVKATRPSLSDTERRAIAQQHLELVGLAAKAAKKPQELSGGQKQRVAIARALATRPKVLLLDEPFGALDALTREEMQEEVLKIWEANRTTVLMVTHEIDEAILMADRIVMMTNGPAATIGEVFEVHFPRPRSRSDILEDPAYYTLRNQILAFLYDRFGDPVLAE
ncbi:ABC transporter ATP-binding protein [Gloeobacter kilaueensis]|uniref:Nitrate ABC transporter, ATPase subunits C and D n=1 Tax=Gloeobacter kilaueensis (strain ATCC BAA-2537 / CCAP 1431/1 / ULC 316 / JS1) TaxID=1183438 RepID=U5QRX2_GLOK1|nr:nitrate ABC transporter ATP-binding protein [Gloeobacter kilaueensis]AGY60440.1 nitrate ABC transporter, ATPase subunits C and D [Gloeobacter kilaueensis JS1]